MIVKKLTLGWLLSVANFVAEEFNIKRVEVVSPISIEKDLIELEAITEDSGRYFMMVWVNEKGIPVRARITSSDGQLQEKEIVTFSEEIGI